jgi:hypothetical protein
MKSIIYILACLVFSSCATNYHLTTFYVKNNSDKTINFKASIVKQSTMGAFNMTLPFTVLPNDSVIARKASFRKDILPTQWFTQFIIFPVDSVLLNDPNDPDNWIKSTDAKGKPVYKFNIAK